jgi:hypothetical protein
LKETRPLWPPQRGVGLQEPNLGKTNPRVTLFICLRFVFHPLSWTRFLFLTLTRLVVVFLFVNFSFALFTPPPLGDYQFPKARGPWGLTSLGTLRSEGSPGLILLGILLCVCPYGPFLPGALRHMECQGLNW